MKDKTDSEVIPGATAAPRWQQWAQKLQAIAQSGLHYTENPFEIERYEAVREIAAEMMAAHTDADADSLRAIFAGERGHATPKVDVRGVVFRDDTILLVRERADGLWTLPGGWVDVGEPPSQAVVREVWEESGYRTRAVKLVALYDRNQHPHPPHPFHIYKLFFHCELLGGDPAHSMETDGVGFFAADALPDLSIGRVTPGQIARLFAHYRHPDWPTDFD
jgi:ADP-ribose pyrophosphatase YjhB (NUDIX family)